MSSVPDKPVEVISVAPSAPKKSAYVPKSQQPVQKEQLTQQQQIDKAQIDKQSEKAAQVQKDVEDVVAVMQTNIAKVVARGEKLETLQSKTDDLSTAGFNFKKTAGKVESEMWWKNAKLTMIIAGVSLTVVTVGIIYFTRTYILTIDH